MFLSGKIRVISVSFWGNQGYQGFFLGKSGLSGFLSWEIMVISVSFWGSHGYQCFFLGKSGLSVFLSRKYIVFIFDVSIKVKRVFLHKK